MKSEIKKVRIKELTDFFANRSWDKSSVVPISLQRVNSYCLNPNAKPDDVSLYYIEENNRIVAFRTVWADHVTVAGKQVRFAWCSGNWVAPNWRRKGISNIILQEVWKDWDGKLMFTNYAPESLLGYIKIGLFPNVVEREGLRFYGRKRVLELLDSKLTGYKISFLKSCAVVCVRIYAGLKRAYVPYVINDIEVVISNDFEYTFSEKEFDSDLNLFNRTYEEYQWIFNNQWITSDVNLKENYPFTQYEKDFNYTFFRINYNETDSGYFAISVRNSHLKVLFHKIRKEHRSSAMKYLLNYCNENKIEMLTLFDKVLIAEINLLKHHFIAQKSHSMNIYSTFELNDSGKCVFDGDGDYIFT